MDLDNVSCSVYYKRYPDPSSSVYSILPFATIYVLLFVLGLAGNSLLIYVTLKNKTLQTVQNIFILNLAASDVMMCLLSLPITPVTNIYKNWYFGSILCHLIPCIQGVSILICTFSLGAIAVDRYILVVTPHARPLSRRGAFIATVVLWIISFIVTLPYAFYMEMVDYEREGICGKFCTEHWPSAFSRRAYTMMVMAFQFLVPFTCMAYCYLMIFEVLSKRAKVKLRRMDERSIALEQSCVVRAPSNQSLNKKLNGKDDSMNSFLDKQEKERQRLAQQTRRTTSILVAMVVWFGLTWLPHNVVSLIIEYDNDQNFFHLFGQEDMDISYLLNLFTHCFAMSNNVVNPVLYAWLNPTFRQLVVNTCLGGKDKHRTINKKSAYLNLPSRITEVSHAPRVTVTDTSMVLKQNPVDTMCEHLLPKNDVEHDKKSVLIEFSENDTFV